METSPDEFVEMRIRDRILKEIGNGNGKRQGKRRQIVRVDELSHYDVADLTEDGAYRKLKAEDKVKIIEHFVEVKAAKG